MKKELFIGIIIGLILGFTLGHLVYTNNASNEEGYTCPEPQTVNCMPMVLPSDNIESVPCSGPYHDWIKENCPNVEFVY